MTFGDRLRKARLQKGLTQEQLAQQIGVAKSTLTGYEKGNREPDVFKIKRILEILEVDSDYLLGVLRESELNETTQNKPENASLHTAESTKLDEALSIFKTLRPEFQDYALDQIKKLAELQEKK